MKGRKLKGCIGTKCQPRRNTADQPPLTFHFLRLNLKRIRQQLLYAVKISFIHERSGPQISHPLWGLARQEMALVTLAPLDLAGRGHFEPFRCTSVGLQLWHLFLRKKYAGDEPR